MARRSEPGRPDGRSIPAMLYLIFVLVLVGIGLYLINTMVPMDPKIKTLVNIVVVLFVVFWILQAFGLLSGFPNPPNLRR